MQSRRVLRLLFYAEFSVFSFTFFFSGEFSFLSAGILATVIF